MNSLQKEESYVESPSTILHTSLAIQKEEGLEDSPSTILHTSLIILGLPTTEH